MKDISDEYNEHRKKGMKYECLFFFFQAEDGIRDVAVTGVQTCALPISSGGSHEQPSADRRSRKRSALPLLPGHAAHARRIRGRVGRPDFPDFHLAQTGCDR